MYLCLIPIITVHEWGHAWTASKLGDDTARLYGRVSLNPIVHMDMFGTVILPGIAIALSVMNSSLAGFIIGWGKPVPINPNNFSNRRRDDILVSVAGPAMNLILAAAMIFLAGLVSGLGLKVVQETCFRVALLSLFLGFFNLIPIPPLDGSHIVQRVFHFSEESFLFLSRYGIFILILVIQIPAVMELLSFLTVGTLRILLIIFGMGGG